MDSKIIYDCIIVGGGASGLRCATLLKGKQILVLEARDRVGGRTYGVEVDGYTWDLGGQWVGAGQHRLINLIKELNQSTFPQQQQGKKVLEVDGHTSVYTGTIPPVGIIGLIEAQLTLWRLEKMAKKIDPKEPWKCKNAGEWDSISCQAWIDRNVYTRLAKKLVHISIVGVYSCDPKEMSLLFALTYFNSAGGVMKTLEVPNGAQQDRIYGGSYNLSKIMAKTLGDGTVRLSSQVTHIDQDLSGKFANVHCSNGTVYQGKLIVMSAPPLVAQQIEYKPRLPTPRSHLQQRMVMGQVIKFIVFYDSCFWRELGFAGEIVTDRESAAIMYDGSFEDGSRASIIGFFEGSAARDWGDRSIKERKKEVLDILYRAFNDKRAYNPTRYEEMNWMEEKYSLGGYAGVMPPGVLTSVGNALRQPFGRIHFAGSETATEWTGYIEGALQSAERVAKEITDHLKTIDNQTEEELLKYEYIDSLETRSTNTASFITSTFFQFLIVLIIAIILYKFNLFNF